ncbi:unnamed protein product [Arctogadus glacialis]
MPHKEKTQGGIPGQPSTPSNGPARTLLPDVKAQGGNGPKFGYPSVLRCLPLSVRPSVTQIQPDLKLPNLDLTLPNLDLTLANLDFLSECNH